MIDPGDSYVSTLIGPLMSALLPAHVMYIAVIAICYWILYSHPPLELHLATLCLAGMVVALTLEIVLAYKQHQLQAQKDPS